MKNNISTNNLYSQRIKTENDIETPNFNSTLYNPKTQKNNKDFNQYQKNLTESRHQLRRPSYSSYFPFSNKNYRWATYIQIISSQQQKINIVTNFINHNTNYFNLCAVFVVNQQAAQKIQKGLVQKRSKFINSYSHNLQQQLCKQGNKQCKIVLLPYQNSYQIPKNVDFIINMKMTLSQFQFFQRVGKQLIDQDCQGRGVVLNLITKDKDKLITAQQQLIKKLISKTNAKSLTIDKITNDSYKLQNFFKKKYEIKNYEIKNYESCKNIFTYSSKQIKTSRILNNQQTQPKITDKPNFYKQEKKNQIASPGNKNQKLLANNQKQNLEKQDKTSVYKIQNQIKIPTTGNNKQDIIKQNQKIPILNTNYIKQQKKLQSKQQHQRVLLKQVRNDSQQINILKSIKDQISAAIKKQITQTYSQTNIKLESLKKQTLQVVSKTSDHIMKSINDSLTKMLNNKEQNIKTNIQKNKVTLIQENKAIAQKNKQHISSAETSIKKQIGQTSNNINLKLDQVNLVQTNSIKFLKEELANLFKSGLQASTTKIQDETNKLMKDNTNKFEKHQQKISNAQASIKNQISESIKNTNRNFSIMTNLNAQLARQIKSKKKEENKNSQKIMAGMHTNMKQIIDSNKNISSFINKQTQQLGLLTQKLKKQNKTKAEQMQIQQKNKLQSLLTTIRRQPSIIQTRLESEVKNIKIKISQSIKVADDLSKLKTELINLKKQYQQKQKDLHMERTKNRLLCQKNEVIENYKKSNMIAHDSIITKYTNTVEQLQNLKQQNKRQRQIMTKLEQTQKSNNKQIQQIKQLLVTIIQSRSQSISAGQQLQQQKRIWLKQINQKPLIETIKKISLFQLQFLNKFIKGLAKLTNNLPNKQSSNFIQNSIQYKQLNNLLTHFNNKKNIQTKAAQLMKCLGKLVSDYDLLKKQKIRIMDYSKQLGLHIKTTSQKIQSAFFRGETCKTNFKQNEYQQYFEGICLNSNKFIEERSLLKKEVEDLMKSKSNLIKDFETQKQKFILKIQQLQKQKAKQIQQLNLKWCEDLQKQKDNFKLAATNYAIKIEKLQQQYKRLQQVKNQQLNKIMKQNIQKIDLNAKRQQEIQIIINELKQQKINTMKVVNNFQAAIGTSIANILEQDLVINISNYKEKLSQFQKNLFLKMNKMKFLNSSILYREMNSQDKQFIYQAVQKVVPRNIAYTTCLLERYEGSDQNQWPHRAYGKQNIIFLITLKNGFKIGGFSQKPISKQKYSKGLGFLMSITNKKIYNIKPKHQGKVANYDENLFVFGNSEFVVKINLEFSVIFKSIFSFFETGTDKLNDFIGQQNDKGEYLKIEIHQIVFEQ